MSVVDIEVRTNQDRPKEFWEGKFLCQECHVELVTSMNVGLPERIPCERCGASRHTVYMVES